MLSGPARFLAGMADTVRLIARVASLSARVPRHPDVLWDTFWAGITMGALTESVIWEPETGDEMDRQVQRASSLMDTGLPVVDLGCGSGAATRRLAGIFPAAVGIDVSAAAVSGARSAAAGTPGVRFGVLDAAAPQATAALARELGDANVFVRGVFHVLSRRRQRALAESVRTLLGTGGRLYLVESNVPGGALSYLRGLGASGRGIPGPLRQAIETLPKPGHFGPPQMGKVFPGRYWTVVADGATTLDTAPAAPWLPPVPVPAYWAVLGPRGQQQSPART